MKFEDFNKEQLWDLRQQIILDGLYFYNYENNYGIDPKSVSAFFDGYYDYIWNLAEEENKDTDITTDIVLSYYDNSDNLLSWYNCYDDFSWVMYEEV